jgi:hypothetical protein
MITLKINLDILLSINPLFKENKVFIGQAYETIFQNVIHSAKTHFKIKKNILLTNSTFPLTLKK